MREGRENMREGIMRRMEGNHGRKKTRRWKMREGGKEAVEGYEEEQMTFKMFSLYLSLLSYVKLQVATCF